MKHFLTSLICLATVFTAMKADYGSDVSLRDNSYQFFIKNADGAISLQSDSETPNGKLEKRYNGPEYNNPDRRVLVGYFNYDLFENDRKAKVIGNSFNSWRGDEYKEKIAAAFPNGTFEVPKTVEVDGVSYTVVAVEEFGFPEIKEVILPETIEVIWSEAFSSSSIKNIKLPESVVKLGSFQHCKYLETFEIGKNVCELPASLLWDCPNVKSVTISEENPYYKVVGDYIMSDEGRMVHVCWNWLKEDIDDLPVTTEVLNEDLFRFFPNLRSVKFPSSIREIRVRTFADCVKLESVELPESIEAIGHGAFTNTGIKELKIPDSMTYLQGCGGMPELEKVYIGKGVEWLGSGSLQSPAHGIFKDCKKLKEIIVSDENSYWKSVDNVIYNKCGSILAAAPGAVKVFENLLPSTLVIGSTSFSWNSAERIILPPHVWSLSGFSFELVNLTEPLTLPYTARFLDSNVFFDYLPSDVYMDSPIAHPMPKDFIGTGYKTSHITIHVPQGSGDNYRNSPQWNTFRIAEDLPAKTMCAIDFDYCGSYFNGSDRGVLGIREGAIKMPASVVKSYAGKQITGVQFENYLTHGAYAFIYRASDNKLLAYQDGTPIDFNTWTQIRFDSPYIIDENDGDLMIGVGFPDGGGLEFSRYVNAEGSYVRGGASEDWNNSMFGDSGAWNLVASIEGENMPYDGAVRSVDYNKMTTDGKVTVKGYIENMSPNNVKEMTVAYTISRPDRSSSVVSSGEFTVTGEFPYRSITPFEFDVPVVETGNLLLDLEVVKLDDKEDAVKGNGSGILGFTHQRRSKFERRVVLESGVGTWCPNSPAGIAGIIKAKKAYPENLIAITIHGEDEMTPGPAYQQRLQYYPGFPGGIVNRKGSLYIYPDFTQIEKAIAQEANIAVADIKASAIYTSSDNSNVLVSTESLFAEDAKDSYSIACAVIEDGVGPYIQSSRYTPEELGIECDFSKMFYDYVAREIYYAEQGSAAANIADVTPEVSYSREMVIPLPENVADKKNIKIAAMLVNNKTGEIENACLTGIQDSGKTSVEMVESIGLMVRINGSKTIVVETATDYTVFTPDGKVVYSGNENSLTLPSSGIYLIKSGNKTCKIIL